MKIRVELQITKYLVFSMVLKEKKSSHMNKDGGVNMVVEQYLEEKIREVQCLLQ